VSYYRTDFQRLKPGTQRLWRGIIEAFRREHGDKLVARLEPKHVRAIVAARASTPHSGNNLLKVLGALGRHAADIGMAASNPAAGIKRFRTQGDGFHCWSESEISLFKEHHPIGRKARLAFALLLHTAQRRADVIGLGWQHVQGDVIALRQQKTDTPLWIQSIPSWHRRRETI
jgi:integrase